MKEARQRDANDPYAIWLSGLVSYAMGRYVDAHELLFRLWTERKSWPETVDMGVTYDILGRVAIERGELFTAAFMFSKAADENPENWQVHFMLGVTEFHRERMGHALDAITKARGLRASDPRVLEWYARINVAAGERHRYYSQQAAKERLFPNAEEEAKKAEDEYNASVRYIRDAIAANPRSPDNFELLGLFYSSQRRSTDAVAAFRKAVALEEDSVGARYFLARELLKSGQANDKKEAIGLLTRAIAINPWWWMGDRNAPHVGLLLSVLIEEGELSRAQALLQWVDRLPEPASR